MSAARGVRERPESDGYGGVGGASGGAGLSFSVVDAEVLLQAVQTVTGRGDALVLSLTSDHGAFSIRVLADKMVHKWYPDSLDALHVLLRELQAVE